MHKQQIWWHNTFKQGLYENFLSIHVAITILASPSSSPSEIDYAEELLRFFIKVFAKIYGKHLVSHNVHALSHLAADTRHLGPLDTWSAFPFESHMCTIKKLLRKPSYPLEQLSNRLAEKRCVQSTGQPPASSTPRLVAEHHTGPLVPQCRGPQFKRVVLPGGTVLDTGMRNSCCKLIDGSIVQVANIAYSLQGTLCIIGRKFRKQENLYTTPCPSSALGIFIVSQPSALKGQTTDFCRVYVL
ncbi:uncharacterized protein LOC144149663 [Haemaphysalis longicornis]